MPLPRKHQLLGLQTQEVKRSAKGVIVWTLMRAHSELILPLDTATPDGWQGEQLEEHCDALLPVGVC